MPASPRPTPRRPAARLTCTRLEDRWTPAIDLTFTGGTVAEFRPDRTLAGTLAASEPGGGRFYSYTLVAGDGSADNGAFGIVDNQLLTQRPLDSAAKASLSVRVRVTDETGATAEEAFAVAVTDDPNVALVGRTLYVAGTAGADSFVATSKFYAPIDPPGVFVDRAAGPAAPTFDLNGQALGIAAGTFDAVVFNGRGGADAAHLMATTPPGTTGAGDPRVAAIVAPGGAGPGYGVLQRPQYSVFVDAPRVTVAGDFNCVAYLAGTAGADTLTATPDYATLAGAGYFSGVTGFLKVAAYGNGGGDRASLGAGPEFAHLNTGTTTTLSVPTAGFGYSNTAVGFPRVDAYAGTGGGRVASDATATDISTDAGTGLNVVVGPGYEVRSLGFRGTPVNSSPTGRDLTFSLDNDERLVAVPDSEPTV